MSKPIAPSSTGESAGVTAADAVIRRADVADIPLIRRLAAAVFPRTYADIITPEQSNFMFEWMYGERSLHRQMDEGHIFFIATVTGRAQGYVSVRRQDADVFRLEKLYVLPSAQGTGLGARLFRHAVAEARAAVPPVSRMELNVNRYNSAVTFYEHMGMHRAAQGDFPIGHGYYMNDYIMALDL